FRNENQHLTFQSFKPNREQVRPNELIVPCRANSPNVTVELEKR
ncbi:unnamed protein product, partial [Allacma fusca]